MYREAMKALAEVEIALVDAGVPEDDAAALVDGFEDAVEECLDELEREEAVEDGDDEGTEENDRAKEGYRKG